MAEVSLESLEWAAAHCVPSVLDSPSGHIRHFFDVVQRESERWIGRSSRAHPTRGMVSRVEREYRLADRIRVASSFTMRTMVDHGVPADKVSIVPYPLDLHTFTPAARSGASHGPLRVTSVGMLALHKGFVYLLRGARLLGPSALSIRLVGGTVDRDTRRLVADEQRGLDATTGPAADLDEVFRQSDLFVFPSLHDGFGFAVAEAMAAGLPAIVTDHCGAADLVEHGVTGWIVRAGSAESLGEALNEALERRRELPAMGEAARRAIVERSRAGSALSNWVFGDMGSA
jgi:glycosyltransferase involved in cell wall biosynthesis